MLADTHGFSSWSVFLTEQHTFLNAALKLFTRSGCKPLLTCILGRLSSSDAASREGEALGFIPRWQNGAEGTCGECGEYAVRMNEWTDGWMNEYK